MKIVFYITCPQLSPQISNLPSQSRNEWNESRREKHNLRRSSMHGSEWREGNWSCTALKVPELPGVWGENTTMDKIYLSKKENRKQATYGLMNFPFISL